jgi:acyl-CoA reductase-like NAD-dependent aldehyde dehydrogenase
MRTNTPSGAPSLVLPKARGRPPTELGGKNALLAFADVDSDAVAGGIVAGMNFAGCGQSCGSTPRAFLHKDIHDAVLVRLRPRGMPSRAPGLTQDKNIHLRFGAC